MEYNCPVKTAAKPGKTISQLRKEALKAPKYVLHTNQFGYDMYVADEELSNGSPLTDKLEEALLYSVGYDNEKLKLGYWRAATGLDLKVKQL